VPTPVRTWRAAQSENRPITSGDLVCPGRPCGLSARVARLLEGRFVLTPGMPEITGQSQAGTLEPAEEMAEAVEVISLPANHVPQSSTDLGVCLSPLRLRLNDFSGEGERAPPAE